MQTNSDLPESEVSRARSRFGLLLGGVYRQWRRQADLSFKTLNLSDATRLPLLALYAHDGPHMRQKDLAHVLHLDTSSLVRVLSQLRDAGHVDWEADPEDRRAKCIELTPSGQEVASQILAKSLEIERMILEGVTPEELAVTRRTLEKITARFEALHQHDSQGNCLD